jgi:hypothetical protein
MWIGVAYCRAPWTTPKTFQAWSHLGHEAWNKTPSRLAYVSATGAIKDWGYFVDINDKSVNVDIKEHFKLQLDPTYQDDFQDITHEDAKRFYRDYLTCVHDHIARYFRRILPQWATMCVEWSFSVPTTWRNPGLMPRLLEIMKAAGFGGDGKNHTCMITLTEAEAAAITVTDQLKVKIRNIHGNSVLRICSEMMSF